MRWCPWLGSISVCHSTDSSHISCHCFKYYSQLYHHLSLILLTNHIWLSTFTACTRPIQFASYIHVPTTSNGSFAAQYTQCISIINYLPLYSFHVSSTAALHSFQSTASTSHYATSLHSNLQHSSVFLTSHHSVLCKVPSRQQQVRASSTLRSRRMLIWCAQQAPDSEDSISKTIFKKNFLSHNFSHLS